MPETKKQEEEQQKEPNNIYILPLIEDPSTEDVLRMLILADGNNRASLENKSYDDGGRNVISHAEALVREGGISLMAACILGPDNIKKRPPEFKKKITAAFRMLCERMEKKGTLISSGIRLETYGDLDGMAQNSPADAELVEVIREACQKTAHIEHPSMRLVLGINYDPDIAINLGIHMMNRSGLETENNYRTSGIRVHPGMRNYGVQTLWPDVQEEDTLAAVRDCREKIRPFLRTGYPAEKIPEMIRALDQKPDSEAPVSITIPYQSNPAELQRELRERLQTEQLLYTTVELYGTDGKMQQSLGPGSQNAMTIKLIHGAHHHESSTYTAFIAPGQTINAIMLPSEPEIGYANVHASPKNPEAIAECVREAIGFTMNTAQLKGAERSVKMEELPEFREYHRLIPVLSQHGTKAIEEIAKMLMDEGKTNQEQEYSEHDRYNFMADLFVAKIIDWSNKAGIPWPSAPAFRAFINYAFTSFFFAYFPNHPKWGEGIEEQWEQKATLLSKYMVLTYAMDDFIFDLPVPEEQKKSHLDESTAALINAVQHPDQPLTPVPDGTLGLICEEFRRLTTELQAAGSPETFKNWQQSMIDIMSCMRNEWQEDVLNNRILGNSCENEPDPETIGEFKKHYLNKTVPGPVRKLIERSLQTYTGRNAPEQERKDSFHDLKLFAYLVDIEKSIGSGNIYKTMACINSRNKNISPETLEELDEICALINHYFRIANDLAEYSRSPEDRDEKTSSVQILGEKYKDDGNGEQAGAKYLMELMLHLRESLYGMIDRFQQKHDGEPLMDGIGVALQRARIGELFYQGTHYREAKRPMVKKFFLKLHDCGINAA